MIIVLKPDTTDAQLNHLVERVEELGFRAHVSKGTQRTIVGVIGDEQKLQAEPLAAIPGVEQVIPVLKPFKLASKEGGREPSVFDINGVKVGGGNLMMIAGPCSVETEEIMRETAAKVRKAGANVFRGGAFKPRTSPYSFQGLGEPGLQLLRRVGDEFGMPIITEVMDPRQVELVDRYTDIIQIGARNMQNFNLLAEVGKTRRAVVLKRGMGSTVKELLMSAEYILAEGNQQVILCERGVRSIDSSTRNMLDLAAVPNLRKETHLPVIVDPSHATGRPDLIPSMARASVAAGADGVHIEVHPCPEKAWSDGDQALLPEQYASAMVDMKKIADVFGYKITYKS